MYRLGNSYPPRFYQRGLILALLLSIVLVHTRIPTIASYSIVSLIYISIYITFIKTYNEFIAPRYYLVLFFLIAVIASVRIVISPSVGSTVRLGAFLIFTAANIFIIPRIFTFNAFTFVLSRFSALVIIIGFLPYLGLSPSFGGIDLSLWHGRLYWKPTLNPITSVFYNPNALGFLSLMGSLASLSEIRRSKSILSIVLFSTSITGLFWSNYRTGIIALLISLSLYVIYILWGEETYIVSVSLMIAVIGIGLSWVFGLVWGPEFLTEISLNNRRPLWIAGYQALLDAPIIGHGLGQSRGAIEPYLGDMAGSGLHNAYLRMFVETGIVGGLIYLLFTVSAVVGSARAHTQRFIIISLLLVCVTIIQIFNGLGIIGISMHSVIMSLMIGYHATGDL